VPPRPLQGIEGEIPGGHGFVIAKERAQSLAEEHHAEFLALGVYLFSTEYLAGENTAVALLPTTDIYRAIAAVGTAGPDCGVSNEDLIAWLRDLEKDQPFLITGIGRDFIEGRFIAPIKDPAALLERINRLCHDDYEEEGQNPADDLFRRIAGQGGE